MQLSDVVRIALIFSEDAKRYAKKLTGSIDLSGKADKKKPAAAGNLAALTADGSLSDSGIDPATKADLQDGKTKTAQMAKSFTFDKTTVKFNY